MHGVYLLWWVQERQMSPALVAAVLAAGDLAIVAFELPTGWCADRFGHRRSLILGSATQVAGMLACWLGEGLDGLLAASVLVAAGDAFRSGAHQALLYRSCAALETPDTFLRIEARADAVAAGGLIALTLAGGLIVATLGFAAGWIAETALCALGLAMACAMVEPPPAAGPSGNPPRATWRSLCSPSMLALIAPAAVLSSASGITSFVAQTTGAGGPAGIATLVGVITLGEAAGSAAAMRLSERGVRQQATLAAIGALLVALPLLHPGALIAAAVVLSFLDGLALPLRSAAIQRLTDDDARARAASLASAFDKALSTFTLPLAGVWSGRR